MSTARRLRARINAVVCLYWQVSRLVFVLFVYHHRRSSDQHRSLCLRLPLSDDVLPLYY